MKLYSTICVLVLSCLLNSATAFANRGPIAVTANENFTVTLFFPSEIDKVIAPANNFQFVYNTNENLGTLRGRKGTNSNLTVITIDGLIFSFSLIYGEKIENFTYVLSKEQAAGAVAHAKSKEVSTQKPKTISSDKSVSNEKSLKRETSKTETAVVSKNKGGRAHTLYEMDRLEYYRIFCENNYMQEARLKDKNTEIGGIRMGVKSVIEDMNEVYVTLEIENRLVEDYQMQEPQFFVKTKSNTAPLKMQVLYAYNYQKVISATNSASMVFVFKDFSLGSDQQVFVIINSSNKNRKQLVLPLESALF